MAGNSSDRAVEEAEVGAPSCRTFWPPGKLREVGWSPVQPGDRVLDQAESGAGSAGATGAVGWGEVGGSVNGAGKISNSTWEKSGLYFPSHTNAFPMN